MEYVEYMVYARKYMVYGSFQKSEALIQTPTSRAPIRRTPKKGFPNLWKQPYWAPRRIKSKPALHQPQSHLKEPYKLLLKEPQFIETASRSVHVRLREGFMLQNVLK